MEVKNKLVAFAHMLSPALVDADGTPLFIEASVEHPAIWNHKQVEAQHIFFSRNEAARKELDRLIERQKSISSLLDDPTPQRNHIFLCLSLTHEGLEASIKLHPDAWVDRQNLQRLLEDHYGAERFLNALENLNDRFTMGFSPNKIPIQEALAAHNRSVSLLQNLIKAEWPQNENIPSLPMPHGSPAKLFQIGCHLPKDVALAYSENIEKLIDWTRKTFSSLLPIYHLLAWSRSNDRVSVKQALEKEKTSQRQQGLSKQDRVRVLKGLWAGKSGLIQEVDAKGQLKISLGSISIKVDAADVEKVK